jgi:hypothetical protein
LPFRLARTSCFSGEGGFSSYAPIRDCLKAHAVGQKTDQELAEADVVVSAARVDAKQIIWAYIADVDETAITRRTGLTSCLIRNRRRPVFWSLAEAKP